jgi:glycosyltransferase involved in cell wall biosynthesis
MKKPKISVIMAAYNSQEFIALAIESIINQTFKEWELIIINDASTDRTYNILKSYKKIDKRIRIINLKNNSGPSKARNEGLKIAKGIYIAILDSDDISLPNRLRMQYDYLEKNKETFLVCSEFIIIDRKGKIIVERKFKNHVNLSLKDSTNGQITHSSWLFRNLNFYNYQSKIYGTEDLELLKQIKRDKRRIDIYPEILVKYRLHEESLTSKNRESEKERILSFLYENESYSEFRKYLIRYIKMESLNKWRKYLKYYFASYLSKDKKDKIRRLIKIK